MNFVAKHPGIAVTLVTLAFVVSGYAPERAERYAPPEYREPDLVKLCDPICRWVHPSVAKKHAISERTTEALKR